MWFAELADAIEGVYVPLDAAALVELVALRDRLDAKVAGAVADADAAGLYDAEGATSTTAFLRHRADASPEQAARLVSRARALGAFPTLRAAAESGRATGGQVDVILRLVGRHRRLFADHEADVVPTLLGLSIDATAEAMAEWRQRADNLNPPKPDGPDSDLRLARYVDRRMSVRADLDADDADALEAALHAADPRDRSLTMPQRRANALATVCRAFLGHQRCERSQRDTTHLHVVVTADQLAAADNGITGVASCDAVLQRLVVDGRGVILDHGRAQRLFPDALRRTIEIRDGGCRFPGCDRPVAWCDAHHIEPWEDGGPTSLANGVLLCRRHHKIAHRPGYRLRLHDDGTLEIRSANGRVEASVPALATLRHGHRRRRRAAQAA